MRINQFQGLITQASSYALPPGAFQDLVNFETTYPGQLTPRDGIQTLTAPSGPGLHYRAYRLTGDINNGDGALLLIVAETSISGLRSRKDFANILCEDSVDLTTENDLPLEVE